nr:BspA family leucine-rich repeat surface protein [uncultured Brachyspira sp.]
MFFGAENFNQPLNNWNVSKVKNMNSIFSGCESFNQSIEDWEINKTCVIDNIFENAFSFKNIKSILNIYFIARGNHKKKLLSMLEECNIKEVYTESIKYHKLKDFIEKLENVYYDELKELIHKTENYKL